LTPENSSSQPQVNQVPKATERHGGLQPADGENNLENGGDDRDQDGQVGRLSNDNIAFVIAKNLIKERGGLSRRGL
jgi:hypothetical protein